MRIKAKNLASNYPIYFFDSQEKEFGFCEYVFRESNEEREADIQLKTLIIDERYRETTLNKLVWTQLFPYLLKAHGDFKTIFIDVRIPHGKENTKEKIHDELWCDNRIYFKSLGAAMFKGRNTGILYVNKFQEQLKKFKNN